MDTVSQISQGEYVAREMKAAGWDDQTVLVDDDIIARWRLSDSRQSALKQIKLQIDGESPTGIKLPCLKVSERTRRFRARDLLEYEWMGMYGQREAKKGE